jgi:hypothetical protein
MVLLIENNMENKMNIKYKKSFGGRDKYWSCKLKKDRTNDCVVRALAHATDTDYLVVWNELFELGRDIGFLPDAPRCYEKWLSDRGWVKHSPLTHSGRRKYSLKNIPIDPDGIYIFVTCGHLTAVVGGVLLDSWDCRPWKANSYFTKPNHGE